MIQEKIRQDLNRFMRERNELAVSVLRMLVSALQDKEKKKRYLLSTDEETCLSDEETLGSVVSEIKKRKESITAFEKAGDVVRAKREKEELALLSGYLPEQMRMEDLTALIKKTIDETNASGPKDIGKVMTKVIPLVKGKADGAEVGRLVKEMLTQQ